MGAATLGDTLARIDSMELLGKLLLDGGLDTRAKARVLARAFQVAGFGAADAAAQGAGVVMEGTRPLLVYVLGADEPPAFTMEEMLKELERRERAWGILVLDGVHPLYVSISRTPTRLVALISLPVLAELLREVGRQPRSRRRQLLELCLAAYTKDASETERLHLLADLLEEREADGSPPAEEAGEPADEEIEASLLQLAEQAEQAARTERNTPEAPSGGAAEEERELERLERMAVEQPENARVFRRLAELYLEEGRREEAVEALYQATGLVPGDIEGHLTLARLLEESGQLEAALVEYTKVLNLDPSNTSALEALARLS